MDKQQIIDYVMNSPANTNKMVLSDMLDGLGSGIETTTVFDEDIVLSASERQFLPVAGMYSSTNTTEVNKGYLRLTWDNIVFEGLAHENNNFDGSFYLENSDNFSIYQDSSNTTYPGIQITYVNQTYNLADMETYCQTPHHLKIEWFTI